MWRIVFRNRALVFYTLFTLVMLIGQFVQSVRDFRNLEARTAGKIESLAGMARAVVKDQLVDVRQLTLVDVTEQYVRQEQLRTEAPTVALTGLANRRAFAAAAELEIARACNGQSPLAVLSLDLDHFKRVNDQQGHASGDLVLMEVARRLRDVMREGDLPARLGGEEFAVLLPDTTLRQAEAVAERIRQVVAATPVAMADDDSLSITASIGVAQYRDSELDLDAAMERADQALYRAKTGGRDRVESTAYVAPPKSQSGAPDAADGPM